MKKVFKIRLLNHILITLVLYLPLYISLSMNSAFSSTHKVDKDDIPIKRPLNLYKLEESADTISNMVQKVGAMPVINVKTTNLKENETLSKALNRIKFNSQNINEIVEIMHFIDFL